MAKHIDIEKIQTTTRRRLAELEVDVTRRVPLRPLARVVAYEVGCSTSAALPYVAQVVRVLRAQEATKRRQQASGLDLARVLNLVLASRIAEQGENL